jgi:hypothetical protein
MYGGCGLVTIILVFSSGMWNWQLVYTDFSGFMNRVTMLSHLLITLEGYDICLAESIKGQELNPLSEY